jgi:hypothetical protein
MYKRYSIVLVVLGVIAIIVGELMFSHVSTANAVDSNSWSINLNGIRSFKWPVFLGVEMVILGILVYTTTDLPKGQRF